MTDVHADNNIDWNRMRKKSLLYSWIIILSSCLLMAGCNDDVLLRESEVGPEVDVVLNFGATHQEKIDISTRATLDVHYESMIRNLYVFIFTANGQKVYGNYFDSDDLGETTQKQYWTVTNMPSDNNTIQTSGMVHMTVPSVSSGAEIVLVANVDLDFLNISPERLGRVSKKEDLNELVVSLNQHSAERNAGYFMMTGNVGNVSISQTGQISCGKIMLERLDAKVEVNVQIIPENETNNQKVKQFTPQSWEVVNLPQSALLMPNANEVLALSGENYFNIAPKNFETTKNVVVGDKSAIQYGFSFYTLENKRSGDKKNSVNGNLHNRELRNKDSNGQYDNTNGLWENAPELATYVIIKGELQVEKGAGDNMVADVTYYVHLGNFASDKDNYDIQRNTHYTYTINIKGINNIELEVETSNDNNSNSITESQSGAMGNIYETDRIHTFDAHYGQFVYTVRAVDINVEDMTWYVRTPFGREGVPSKDVNGNDVYNDLDYKWVEFMLNDVKTDNTYSDANKPYPGKNTELLNVVDMINMVKKEVVAWRNGEESKFDENGEMKFTIFVNEFYYQENPMNPNDSGILWKKFVNQPPRLMHILSGTQHSKDGDSSKTNSMLTIRQHSIQTPYNINPAKTDLSTAWGCETVDDMYKQAWFYSPKERLVSLGWEGITYKYYMEMYNNQYTPILSHTANNTSRTDGLYNTAALLNFLKNSDGNSLRWSTFLNYETEELQLKGDYRAGLYSVFLRNRDLDGDDIVDAEELRWYIASLDQLCGLFLGDQGLSADAQLYPLATNREPNSIVRDGSVFDGVYPWRLHVVSSTAWQNTAGNLPTVVWAEEGISTGQYQTDWGKPGYSPIHCVRNLGMPDATMHTIVRDEENYPKDRLVKVTYPLYISPDVVYKFDFTNMNEESRRYYTTRELAPDDEYSLMSRLYDGFETGPLLDVGFYYHDTETAIGWKNRLESGESTSLAPSYRIPNLREGAVMHLYCREAYWWGGYSTMVNNYYSFGILGNYEIPYDWVYSWNVSHWTITMNIGNSSTWVRFVKDWNPQ